ncbi:MAG: PAS domain S-box protein [Dehalococcoidales bacterium]|jgi:PAS domain S-box-containing protein
MNDEDKTKEQLIPELARLRQRIAELECQETESKQAEETITKRVRELSALNSIASSASSSLELRMILDLTLDTVLEVCGLETGSIYLFDETAKELVLTTYRGCSKEFANSVRVFTIGQSLVGRAGQTGEILVEDDITQDPRVKTKIVTSENIISFAAIPIKSRGKLFGVMNIASRRHHHFTTEYVNLYKAVSCIIGVSIYNASLYRDLQVELSERKQAEEALKDSEKKYRELADFLPQTVFEFDTSGNFTFANRHGFQSFGYTPEDIKRGLNALQLFIPGDRVRVKKNIQVVLGGRKPKGNEYTALRKDGSTYPVIVYSSPIIHEGKPVGLRGIVTDITEPKQIDDALQKSHEQLRSLTAHLQSVREEERTDIARGVHDELGQALTALKMDLSWLGKRLPKGQEALLEKKEVMSELLDSIIQTVKKISTKLRPGILDDFGLVAAIEWQAEEFQKRSGIKCKVSSVTEPHLDRDLNTALFRIFQETLTNAARHTSATRVTVNLKDQDGKMIMRIRDNGKGITPEQLSSPSSFGIIGMRERVRALRGEITIRGIPGKGTTVTVTIPLLKNGESQ